ncbi:MAG TPA: UDPGP type 1 family protein [Gemmatales bacterium]|nr:UDPGP type 1 family protein [Gemmatales bacterium]
MKSELHARLAAFGQDHLLADWDQLAPQQQARLAGQLNQLDLGLLRDLFHERTQEVLATFTPPEPPDVVRLPERLEEWEEQQEDRAVGEELLAAGQVGVVLVAGGQGSRLGHPGPKGTFPIGPPSRSSLFQLHAEKLLARSRQCRQPLPMAIMTSEENDAETQAYFAEHRSFGLEPGQLTFFTQGMMPALDAATGRILTTAPGELAMSPNGHGGVLLALRDSGLLEDWARRGISVLFYFQVDNPLVRLADPVFIGAHVRRGAEASVKVVRKTDPSERIGVVVRRDGCHSVLEYSELPEAWAAAEAPDGGLRLWAGSTAIHVFSIDFLQRLAAARTMLPYHRALKVVPHQDDPEPRQANAIKFEMFIFDALPLADRVLVMETGRAAEFEPLKNAEGQDSPASVQAALCAEFARWIEHSGGTVARTATGEPAHPIEISPLFAQDAAELRGRYLSTAQVTAPLWLGPPPAILEVSRPAAGSSASMPG